MFRVISGNPIAFISLRRMATAMLALMAAAIFVLMAVAIFVLLPAGDAAAASPKLKGGYSSHYRQTSTIRTTRTIRRHPVSRPGYVRGYHTGRSAYLRHGLRPGGPNGHGRPSRRVHTNYGSRYPVVSSGVVLVDTDTGYQSHSGPKIIHYDSTRRQFSTRYLDGSGSLHIVVDSTDSDDAIDPANRVVLEGGSCASDEYCTLRLGTYSNAPKIITLNETGKTISGVPIR